MIPKIKASSEKKEGLDQVLFGSTYFAGFSGAATLLL